MASNLRVDNIQPTTGTGIGIGTANGSVTFNADVTGGMNIATGLVGVGTDNPDHALHLYSGTLGIGKSENTGFEITITDNNLSFSRDAKSFINQKGTGTISVRLGSSYTEVAEFTSDGLKLPSGKGIDFSATANGSGTTTSEIFGDYEEGTFTPSTVLTCNPSSRVITDNGSGTGQYIKIGKVVHCEFRTGFTALSGSGAFNVGVNGLPFPADNTVQTGGGVARSNIDGEMFYMENVYNSQIEVIRRYNNGAPSVPDNFTCHITYITL